MIVLGASVKTAHNKRERQRGERERRREGTSWRRHWDRRKAKWNKMLAHVTGGWGMHTNQRVRGLPTHLCFVRVYDCAPRRRVQVFKHVWSCPRRALPNMEAGDRVEALRGLHTGFAQSSTPRPGQAGGFGARGTEGSTHAGCRGTGRKIWRK